MSTREQQLNEIKSAQVAQTAAKKLCDDITAKLTEIEDAKSLAHLAAAEIPKLKIRKQDFQADISLGVPVKQSEIDKVDAAISKAEADVEEHTRTVAGLKSKLATTQVSLHTAEDRCLVLKRAFVESEAESLCGDYMIHAQNLISAFRRLMALDQLSKGLGGNPFIDGAARNNVFIPVFNFASSGQSPTQQLGHGGNWSPAVDLINTIAYAQADEDAERANLVRLGINI